MSNKNKIESTNKSTEKQDKNDKKMTKFNE